MSDARTVVVIPSPMPEWGDARAHPEYYEGITVKRIIAYALDMIAVMAIAVAVWFAGFILGVLSFGLLFPLQALAVALVPLAYHTLLIAGSRSSTLGMRAMGIKVMSIAQDSEAWGGRPTLLQAMIQTVAFYGSMAVTGSLILLVTLFNPRRRTLHDWLAGTVVVNDCSPGRRTA
ncbi:MAG: RDD family protein [Rhodospirillaceae bacterium]|nr:RDD family protein [Rhodospirillales bacterium]